MQLSLPRGLGCCRSRVCREYAETYASRQKQAPGSPDIPITQRCVCPDIRSPADTKGVCCSSALPVWLRMSPHTQPDGTSTAITFIPIHRGYRRRAGTATRQRKPAPRHTSRHSTTTIQTNNPNQHPTTQHHDCTTAQTQPTQHEAAGTHVAHRPLRHPPHRLHPPAEWLQPVTDQPSTKSVPRPPVSCLIGQQSSPRPAQSSVIGNQSSAISQ